MSKTILAEVNGFTPVIDRIVKECGFMTALVFGRIWRFCQMEDGVCKASQEKIGKSIGVDRHTIIKHADILTERGYLKSDTKVGIGITYTDTGKAGLVIKITGDGEGGNESASTCEQECQVGGNESATKKVINKDSFKETINSGAKKTAPDTVYEPCDDSGEPIKPKKTRKRKSPTNDKSLYPIAMSLSQVTGMSFDANKARIFKEAKLLSADPRVTAEEISKTYSANGDWYKYDWRGKKGQKPTLSQVRETIFTFGKIEKQKVQPKGWNAVQNMIAKANQEEANVNQ